VIDEKENYRLIAGFFILCEHIRFNVIKNITFVGTLDAHFYDTQDTVLFFLNGRERDSWYDNVR
jgi:hypothetical protein